MKTQATYRRLDSVSALCAPGELYQPSHPRSIWNQRPVNVNLRYGDGDVMAGTGSSVMPGFDGERKAVDSVSG